MSTKRFNCQNLNKVNKTENWSNSNKQNKFVDNKNKLNDNYDQQSEQQRGFVQSSDFIEPIATVPINNEQNLTDSHNTKPVVPSSSAEQSINDSLNQTDDDSVVFMPSPTNNEDSNLAEPPVFQNQQQALNDQFNCSPIYSQEINCNTSGIYDYTNSTVPIQQIQQGSPYAYVYQSPYSDYVTPMITNTPQQQTNLYTCGYQAYVYDPNLGAYTLNTYSPMQTATNSTVPSQTNNTNQQQTSILSSPQQSGASILASYHTPRQTQHQLYISTSNITSPNCLSPNDINSTNQPTPNEPIITNSNSPQQLGYQYLVYPTPNPTYLTPQTYQSPLPVPQPQTYMMYQPYHTQQQTPTSIQSVPFSNNISNNNGAQRRTNRYANNRYNKRNNTSNKVNHNLNNNNNNNNNVGAESTPQFPIYNNTINNSQTDQSNNDNTFTCKVSTELNNEEQYNLDYNNNCNLNINMYSPSICSSVSTNPYEYCDPNQMINLQSYYEYVNSGITSYGDDLDDDLNEQDNDNLDQENEQLACYVCRGRRMCFCYFLKVRYYKFPSFLDLVDHQYKKWRSNMIKAKKSSN